MNLLRLIEECEGRSGYNDPDYRTDWTRFLNAGVREFGRKFPWPGLEDIVVVSTDGTRYVVLPQQVDQVVAIANLSNSLPVDRWGDFDRNAPGPYTQQTVGTVIQYENVGSVAALRDPSGYVFAKSSHQSDTAAIYLTGYMAASGASGTALQYIEKHSNGNLNGLSAVTLPVLFTSLLSISKVTNTQGDIYFFDAGNSNRHISFLGQYDERARFKRIQLFYKPSGQTNLEVKYRRRIPTMVANEQSPPPAVDIEYVIQAALKLFWRSKQQFTKGQVEGQGAQETLAEFANKELNFDEPYQQITPMKEPDDPALF